MMVETAPQAVFTQFVDSTRPHTLLTPNPKSSGTLEYRYEDTGEVIRCPHIWYNETGVMRVAAVRWDAKLAIDNAVRFATNPPLGTSPEAGRNIARRYRERAARIEEEADRMEAAWSPTHPVASARVELSYGPNV